MAAKQMEKLGNALAYLGKNEDSGKGVYRRVGTVYKDNRGQISIKIDTLPLPAENWLGWINVFPDRPQEPEVEVGADGRTYDNKDPF